MRTSPLLLPSLICSPITSEEAQRAEEAAMDAAVAEMSLGDGSDPLKNR